MTPYWLTAGLIVAACVNVAVLLWAVTTAFWSINRTMNETRRIWDESERALHRLKNLVSEFEEAARQRNTK